MPDCLPAASAGAATIKDALGGMLTSAPPQFSADEVACMVARHYGLSGALTALSSERDQNLRLVCDAGDFVVKIANLAEAHEATRFQSRALRHIEARDPTLTVPRLRPTATGALDVVLPSGHLLRLISYLHGRPLAHAPRSTAQRRALGAGLARLTQALSGFSDPAASVELVWDIKHASRLRPLLPAVSDPDLRALCARVLTRFDAEVAPHLARWRAQVVHCDFNPHNVLVAEDDPDRMAGILDFGDMVDTPIICDLAVALSYQVDADDPLGSTAAFVQAYQTVLPLTEGERGALPLLTAARMVTTLAITSWRAAQYPENAPYILRNFAGAAAGLRAILATPERDLVQAYAAPGAGHLPGGAV